MSRLNTETRREGTGQSGSPGHPSRGEQDPATIGEWLCLEQDGTIVVYTGKVEVGQDIRTSLAQAVADELHLPLDAIQLVMADTDRTPYDMGTVGSRTTPVMAARLRTVAAALRELLVDQAAERWQVERGTLTVGNGIICHPPTGRELPYAALALALNLAHEYVYDSPVTPAEEWMIAGTSIPKIDGRDFVTGRRRYTSDLLRPGMLYGMLLRAPAYGAPLIALDAREAEALPGIMVVRTDEVVGVVAPSRDRAIQARAALHAEWSTPQQQPSTADLYTYLRQHPAPADASRPNNFAGYETGDIEAGRAAAVQTVEQTYTVAYVAHAPLEPRAALAEWQAGRLMVWTGTQKPFGVRDELAAALGIDADDVRVVVPDTGGAYGGKHTGEVAIEAARLARAVDRPVKVVWTREEEFTWAYFRPAGVIDVAGTAGSDGKLTAWEFHNYNSGSASIRTPYEVPNQRIMFHPTLAPLRQGSYRALAATANQFARESVMDELAHSLGLDPLAFRLQNLQDERLRAVFEAAAAAFGWGAAVREPGHGFGIAGGTEKGSYVATCVEVAVDRDSGQVRVVRVVEAFECGAIVNPDGVRNQVEGAIIQGLGGALFERIEFAGGTVVNGRFSDYRVPRFADTPAIEVVLIDRKNLPSVGASETPIIGIAPALGNAIYDATGIRRRSLPLAPNGVLPDE